MTEVKKNDETERSVDALHVSRPAKVDRTGIFISRTRNGEARAVARYMKSGKVVAVASTRGVAGWVATIVRRTLKKNPVDEFFNNQYAQMQDPHVANNTTRALNLKKVKK